MTGRDRRVLAVGALVIGAMLAITRGVPGWRSAVRERSDAALEIRQQLVHAQQAVAGLEGAEDSLNELRARYLALAPLLLEASGPSTGAAVLASHLSGLAARAGMQFGSFQLTADTTVRRGFVRVGVQASLTGDVAGLAVLLAEVERGRPLLAIRSIAVDQPEPVGSDDRPEALRVSLVVEGLAQARTTNR